VPFYFILSELLKVCKQRKLVRHLWLDQQSVRFCPGTLLIAFLKSDIKNLNLESHKLTLYDDVLSQYAYREQQEKRIILKQ
jgi:hypothetical protein